MRLSRFTVSVADIVKCPPFAELPALVDSRRGVARWDWVIFVIR